MMTKNPVDFFTKSDKGRLAEIMRGAWVRQSERIKKGTFISSKLEPFLAGFVDSEGFVGRGRGKVAGYVIRFPRERKGKKVWEKTFIAKDDVRVISNNPISPQALEYRRMYKDDLKAGHTKAADFWQGAACAAFTGNPDKQPWEMTKKEIISKPPSVIKDFIGGKAVFDADKGDYLWTYGKMFGYETIANVHRIGIVRALSEGKPVPKRVLKDYPNIQNNPILPIIGNAAVTGVGLGLGFAGVNYFKDRILSNPTLKFPVKSKAQLNQIFNAESHLRQAGVLFDTGSDIKNGKPTSRDWELDYSLSGAKIANPSHVKKLKTIAKATGGEYKRKVQPDGMILHTVTYEDGDD